MTKKNSFGKNSTKRLGLKREKDVDGLGGAESDAYKLNSLIGSLRTGN